jgi:hypothetical protein
MKPLSRALCLALCILTTACASHRRLPECRGPFTPINATAEVGSRE